MDMKASSMSKINQSGDRNVQILGSSGEDNLVVLTAGASWTTLAAQGLVSLHETIPFNLLHIDLNVEHDDLLCKICQLGWAIDGIINAIEVKAEIGGSISIIN